MSSDRGISKFKEFYIWNPRRKNTLRRDMSPLYIYSPPEGESRISRYTCIGCRDFSVRFRENGIILETDLRMGYYNYKNGPERMRIVTEIQGDNMLYVGAGVGPTGILANKIRGIKITYVEKNIGLQKYLMINLGLNKQSALGIYNDISEINEGESYDNIIVDIPTMVDLDFYRRISRLCNPGGRFYVYNKELLPGFSRVRTIKETSTKDKIYLLRQEYPLE